MAEIDKFKTSQEITWCSGCGNFGIWVALRQALLKLGLSPEDVLVVYGIGCHGHMINYLKAYGFGGLHGRGIPVATGAKISNHNLNVIVVAGDGDQLGEGGNHLIHAARRNINITCIIHDNQIYGLTVGQTSPTSGKGFKSRSTPEGSTEEPINPISLALASGATFIARGFTGNVNHLTDVLAQGIQHKGFSLVDILQPCVTLNHQNTYQWFYQRVYKLEENNHNPKDKLQAFQKALEGPEKIPIGIFYQEVKLTFEGQLPQLKDNPLAKRDIGSISVQDNMKEFL